jgi:dTDP-4-dehydrorhamnose reductase
VRHFEEVAMRALILGGAGMLGHRLWLALHQRLDAFVTVRRPFADYAALGLFDEDRTIDVFDATRDEDLERALSVARPDVVVNAVGVVKQRREAEHATTTIAINSLFPHRLADRCVATGTRLIHVSTDCVFSGTRGSYTESDIPDARDLYGRSKLLGELARPGCLTLRTSIVGREIASAHGLVEWFLARRGTTAPGFRRAWFSGLTTIELSRVIAMLIESHPDLAGLWHVAGGPIAKFDLLALVNDRFRLGSVLEADDSFVCDRTLDASRFFNATGYRPPTWAEMITEMAADPTPYDAWGKTWISNAHDRSTASIS